MRSLGFFALLLLIIGGLNWGLIGLLDTNLVTEVFSDQTIIDVIYIVFGIAAVVSIPTLMKTS